MIKEVFELKKNAWHVKMINWVWGLHYYDFTHMCNYFWLCVGTLPIMPIAIILSLMYKWLFKPIGLSLIFCISKIGDAYLKVEKYFETLESNKIEKLTERALTDEAFLFELIESYEVQNCRKTYSKIMQIRNRIPNKRYHEFMDKYEEIRLKAWERYHQRQEELRLANEAKKETLFYKNLEQVKSSLHIRKEYANDLFKLLKPVGYAIIAIIAICIVSILIYLLLLLLPLLWKLLLLIIGWPWLDIISVIGMILIIAVGLVGIIFLMRFIFKRIHFTFITSTVKCINWKRLGDMIILIFSPVIWLAKGIVTLIEIFKAFKQNNCPAIKWVDDTENIK